MTDWIVRGQANLLAASRSSDIVSAKREWRMTYGLQILPAATGRCELCEHPKIKYKHEIENQITGSHLWVGSECIKKFVPIFESRVEVIDDGRRSTLVDRIVTEARAADRRQRAFRLLDALARRDRRFAQADWKVNWELGYSVKQLQMIAISARRAALTFNASDFRINTRRGRIMEQFYGLEDWQYRQLRGALTPSRRRDADAHFGFPERSG